MVRDVTNGVAGGIKAVRYAEKGVTNNIPVAYVVEGGKTRLVFKLNQSEYEFVRYQHNEPYYASETISADGSMITIATTANNYATWYSFESDIPSSAVGNALTISFKLNASSTGRFTEYFDNICVKCKESGVYVLGTIYYTGVDTEYSYTIPAHAVVDRVAVEIFSYPEFNGRDTYTYTIKDVMVNGKPCIFNF